MMVIKEVSSNMDSTCSCNGSCNKEKESPTWYKKFEYITGITNGELFHKTNEYLHTIPVDDICNIDYNIFDKYVIIEHLYKQ